MIATNSDKDGESHQHRHDHLYHFSGANKAGMEEMDKNKQSQIIYEMSRNSAFFKHAMEKDSKNDEKIEAILTLISEVKNDESKLLALRSNVINDLARCESKRNLSKLCCVLDMDMFFAAVEIRDNPEMADKPVAVGGINMICTSNYVARKFGVRSAMPGFIAKKLCPELVFIEPNFEKYIAVSDIIKSIVKEYDPTFRSMSLDEVYMDLTTVCTTRFSYQHTSQDVEGGSSEYLALMLQVAEDVVCEIRTRISSATGGLTASAGIAVNFLLAKIAADIKKPNGQHSVPAKTKDILTFVSELPVRKIPGVGKVTERILTSLGIRCVGDLREALPLLLHSFSSTQYQFFLHSSLGVSREEMHADERGAVADKDDGRKSLGASRTFSATASRSEWTLKLEEICGIVSSEMISKKLRARTVTLKVKSAAFQETSRGRTCVRPLQQRDEIFAVCCTLLSEPWPDTALRLIGVTMSGFGLDTSESKGIQRFFTSGSRLCEQQHESESSLIKPNLLNLNEESRNCPAEESKGNKRQPVDAGSGSGSCTGNGITTTTTTKTKTATTTTTMSSAECPLCGLRMPGYGSAANLHIDNCLSRAQLYEDNNARKKRKLLQLRVKTDFKR